jgi:hypothetical protein
MKPNAREGIPVSNEPQTRIKEEKARERKQIQALEKRG